ELDRQIPLLLFAIDVERSRHQFDLRDLAERNLSDAVSVRPLRPDCDVADRFGVLPKLWRQANDDRKVAIAARLVNVAGRFAADGGADCGVDVAGRESVARRAGAVDVDLDCGLTERGEHSEIGDAGYRRQHGLDP